MVRIWPMLLCVASILLTMRPAWAGTRVEVLGTWPSGDSMTLGRNQTFYLHLRYTSDTPVHIWVQPWFEGRPVEAGTNPSRTYPAGTGEALGWFFLMNPGARVDEVKISAGNGSTRGTPVVATYPVSMTGTDRPARAALKPTWVTDLSANDKAAQHAAYEKASHAPMSTGGLVLFRIFMLAVIALALVGLAAPAWGLWRWRGGWRIAAAVPAAIMTFVILRILIGTARDPTSHNLWPFEIVMWGGSSCGWMLVAALARRFSGAART